MKKFVLALAPLFLLWGCQTNAPETPAESETAAPNISQTTPNVAASPTPNSKVKETKSVNGIFRGFNGDEGLTASIELAEDNSLDELGLSGEATLNYFLAANLNKPLEFTYQVLEGAAGTGTVDKMFSAKAGNLTHEAWWQQEKSTNPDETALRKKYDALVEQATEKDDE